MDTVVSKSDLAVIKKKKKPVKKLVIFSIIIVLIAAGVFIYFKLGNAGTANVVAQRTARVIKGQLVDSISGSAPISSSYRSELSPKVTATLQKINCKEGDQVKAGDVLFVLDNTDALLEIENAKNSIAQMELTADSTEKSVKGMTISAPFSGQVSNIMVKEGDSVGKGGAVMTITDVSKLKVSLLFCGTEMANVAEGQEAELHIPELLASVKGTVTYKSSKPYVTSEGDQYSIEITVDNPGSLAEGTTVTGTISINDVSLDSLNSGKLEYVNKSVLKSEAGGTVSSINIRENEFADAGEVLVKLENDDLLLTASTNNIKLESLKTQLEIKQKQLEYYTITAPFDGTITKMGSANEGDTVKQGETLAVISDMNHLEFSLSIDELDISQIKVGQEVEITAEALEETQTEPLTGKVSKVAMEGSSSNGVTTYPVTIAVDDSAAGKLKTGMNIDAEIFINKKSDVLMVPIEAVTKIGDKSFVYVKEAASGTESDQRNVQGMSGNSGRRQPSQGTMPSGVPSGGSGTAAVSPPSSGTGTSMESPPSSGSGTSTANPPSGGLDNSTASQPGSGTDTAEADSQGSQSGGASRQESSQNSSGTTRRRQADSYYDGAVMVFVETGISNDSYIEIISGLTEGQEVILPKTSTASASSTTASFGRDRNSGGFITGGAMPGGAMPGGGPGGF